MNRHAGIRKFKCEQCQAKFFSKGEFERHAKSHTGKRRKLTFLGGGGICSTLQFAFQASDHSCAKYAERRLPVSLGVRRLNVWRVL